MTEHMAERRRAGEALAGRLLGLSEEEAAARSAAEGLPFRVVNRDGQAIPHRLDLRPGRLNASVIQGAITAVRVEQEPRD